MGDFGKTPDKNNYKDLYIFIIAAAAVLLFSVWFGYVYENEGSMFSAVANMPKYLNPINIVFGILHIGKGTGRQLKSIIFGLGGAVIIIMYKLSGSNKRYHRKGTEHGSARWGTQKEKDLISDKADFYNNVIVASDVFLVLDRKRREENEKHGRKKETETNETVKEGDNNDKDILTVKQVSRNKKKSEKIKPMLNLNLMILGGSGTGKSRFWVKPNLMQCNTSFVVTDPSGELLQSCGKMLEQKGYVIKVFNINDMKHSSNYNPFHYLRDFGGNINSNNIIKMINTFMLNTKAEGASSGDQFWDDSTRLLLSALCFLLVETGTEEEQNFANVLDLIHKAKVIEGKEEEKSELDLIMEKHKEDCPDALSVQYYDEVILLCDTTDTDHDQGAVLLTDISGAAFHLPAYYIIK